MTGGCSCGAVRFEVTAPLIGTIGCRCEHCRRPSDTSFTANGLTAPGSFAITRGASAVVAEDPGDGHWLKSFCPTCGSQLYTAPPQNREMVAVSLGALDYRGGVAGGV